MIACHATSLDDDLIYYKNQRKIYEEKLLNIFQKEVITLLERDKYEEAVEICQKHLAVEAKDPIAWHNLGVAHARLRHYKESIIAYQNALKLHPEMFFSQWSMSYNYLILGQFNRGLKDYEARLKHFKTQPKVPNTHVSKKWEGEDISGKTLLVHQEGEIGDSIQNLRYIPLLKRYNCKILIFLQPELNYLLENLNIQTVNDSNFYKYDMHVFMMSLPYCFNTQISTIPNPFKITCDYLPVKKRIGIVWNSNGNVKKTLALEQLSPLFSIPDYAYVCLQKQVSTEESKLFMHYKIDRPIIKNLSDTIKILETCDHVVTIDSDIAHLSGSMDIPTSLLLDYNACWKWLLDRQDSPWYPSVTLFRQKTRNVWEDPILELTEYFTKKRV